MIADASALTPGRVETVLPMPGMDPEMVRGALAPLALRDEPLAEWITDVAAAFARLMACDRVRLRVEVTDEVNCPRFHVDTVRVRLVVTLHGYGTEYMWRATPDEVHRVDTGVCALFKGRCHPTHADSVRHRSPTGEGGGRRVVMIVDIVD